MKKLSCIHVCLFLVAILMGCASYPHVDSSIFKIENDDLHVQVAFGDHDRRAIHDYYANKGTKQKGLPPGLARKRKLPAGLKKQLEKNGKLPPGLSKRHLPSELEERLSRLPKGYVRLKVGGDIVLMNEKTEVIVDIIHDLG